MEIIKNSCRLKFVSAGLSCVLGWTLALSVTTAPLRRHLRLCISAPYLFYTYPST